METLAFATAARRLGAKARELGLSPVPAFRSPPTDPEALRSIRRFDGGAVISVRLRDRADADVIRDMAQGILIVAGRAPDDFDLDILEGAAL